MLKRLVDWFKTRRSRSPAPGSLEAEQEAKRIGDDLETKRLQERQASSRLIGR